MSRKVSRPGSSRSVEHVGQERVERALGDRAAPEPGDDVVDGRRQAREGEPNVLADDAAEADRERLLEHDDPLGVAERLAHLLERVRPEGLDADGPDLRSLLAQLVDDVLDRPEHRPERDHDRLRVGAAVRADQAAGVPPEGLGELPRDLGDHVERLHLRGVHEVLDLRERLGADHGPDRHRVGGVEDLPGLEPRQERVDLLLRRDVDALVGVREDEAVHADHHRERDLLGELERLDVQVDGLLVGLRIELEPAGVALGHRVAVVVPDVDRGADRAVGHRHHDRQAEPRGVVERLRHEEQPLAGRGGVRAGAGRGRADRGRERRELRLDHEVLARRELARPDQIREPLDDVGLRRDRVRGDDLGAAERDCGSDRLGAFDLPTHARPP